MVSLVLRAVIAIGWYRFVPAGGITPGVCPLR